MVATSSFTRMESCRSVNLSTSMKAPTTQRSVCTCTVVAKLTSESVRLHTSPIRQIKQGMLPRMAQLLLSATEFGCRTACCQTSWTPLMLQTCRQRVIYQINSTAKKRPNTRRNDEVVAKLTSESAKLCLGIYFKHHSCSRCVYNFSSISKISYLN